VGGEREVQSRQQVTEPNCTELVTGELSAAYLAIP
jgi:hypothetical protein